MKSEIITLMRRLGDCRFIKDRLCYKLGIQSLKDVDLSLVGPPTSWKCHIKSADYGGTPIID